MLKNLSLLLLLAGFLSVNPLSALSVAAPVLNDRPLTIAQTPAPAPTTPTAPTLTLADLPAGFRELPPTLASQVTRQVEAIGEQMKEHGFNPQKVFVYLKPGTMEVVFGLTGIVEDPALYDLYLTQLQNPTVQQTLFAQLQEKLKNVRMVKVTGYRFLPDLSNIAESSFGLKLNMTVMGMPFQSDLVSFRHDRIGSLTGVMYGDRRTPTLPVRDLAERLDRKITPQ